MNGIRRSGRTGRRMQTGGHTHINPNNIQAGYGSLNWDHSHVLVGEFTGSANQGVHQHPHSIPPRPGRGKPGMRRGGRTRPQPRRMAAGGKMRGNKVVNNCCMPNQSCPAGQSCIGCQCRPGGLNMNVGQYKKGGRTRSKPVGRGMARGRNISIKPGSRPTKKRT